MGSNTRGVSNDIWLTFGLSPNAHCITTSWLFSPMPLLSVQNPEVICNDETTCNKIVLWLIICVLLLEVWGYHPSIGRYFLHHREYQYPHYEVNQLRKCFYTPSSHVLNRLKLISQPLDSLSATCSVPQNNNRVWLTVKLFDLRTPTGAWFNDYLTGTAILLIMVWP